MTHLSMIVKKLLNKYTDMKEVTIEFSARAVRKTEALKCLLYMSRYLLASELLNTTFDTNSIEDVMVCLQEHIDGAQTPTAKVAASTSPTGFDNCVRRVEENIQTITNQLHEVQKSVSKLSSLHKRTMKQHQEKSKKLARQLLMSKEETIEQKELDSGSGN